MLTLFTLLAILALVVLAALYFRKWFSVTSKNSRTVDVTVNPENIASDKASVTEKFSELRQKAKS